MPGAGRLSVEPRPGIQEPAESGDAIDAGSLRLRFDSGRVTEVSHLAADSIAHFGSGVAAISGRPEWGDQSLASIAAESGDGAALLAAYRASPGDFIAQLRGAFVFALFDPEQELLLAGIDRMGRQTLYHARDSDTLYLAGTAADLLQLSDLSGTLSSQGLYDYVYFHMVPSPGSVYRGIGKLPAGQCLECRQGTVRQRRYWQPDFNRRCTGTLAANGEQLRRLLREAVERDLEPGVTTGSFLSGGLDSSTVTGMLAEATGASAPAYAIGFDEPGYDEMEFARIAAQHFGVKLVEYYVTPQDVVDELPTIANSYDEPFGNSSALPAYFCARRARDDGTERLLAGDGGDEIFAGNARYAKQLVFEHYSRLPAWLRSSIIEPVAAHLPERPALVSKVRSYIHQAMIPLPDRLQSYNYLNRLGPESVFTEQLLAAVDVESPAAVQRETYRAPEQASDLSRMLYLDWQYTLADNDLRKVIGMCALAGVEVRFPMLEDALVEFSCTIPDEWKLQPGRLRHFFKQSLSDCLPQATINKKKQGFGLPFGHWMQSYGPLNELAGDSLSRLKGRGYLRPDFLDRLLQLHREEHAAYYGELIWVLTVLDLWLEGRDAPSL